MYQPRDAKVVMKKSLAAKLYSKAAQLFLSAAGQYYGLAFFYLGISLSASDALCQETILWHVVPLSMCCKKSSEEEK